MSKDVLPLNPLTYVHKYAHAHTYIHANTDANA